MLVALEEEMRIYLQLASMKGRDILEDLTADRGK